MACPKASYLIIVVFVLFAFLVAFLLLKSVSKKKDPSSSYGGMIGIVTKFFQVSLFFQQTSFLNMHT